MGRFADIAFTSRVKAVQARMGSRRAYTRMEGGDAGPDRLGEDETTFLAERDSFYIASLGSGGWPYIQHRGGPKGFVRVTDEHTLAFADYRGNRQYVSVGNIEGDDRVALIFVDYPNRARLKVLAHASVTEDPTMLARVADPAYEARVERAIVLRVEGFDWNCPQHITPRFTEEEIEGAAENLLRKLAELEAENKALRARLGPVAKVPPPR